MVMQNPAGNNEVLALASWLSEQAGEALLALPSAEFVVLTQSSGQVREITQTEALTWLREKPHIDQHGPQIWRRTGQQQLPQGVQHAI